MWRHEGPHPFIPKRPPTFVLAPESLAAARASKNRLSRDSPGRTIFDFCNKSPRSRSLPGQYSPRTSALGPDADVRLIVPLNEVGRARGRPLEPARSAHDAGQNGCGMPARKSGSPDPHFAASITSKNDKTAACERKLTRCSSIIIDAMERHYARSRWGSREAIWEAMSALIVSGRALNEA